MSSRTSINISLALLLAAVPAAGCTATNAQVIQPASPSSVNSFHVQGRQILFHAKDRFEYPKAVELLEKAVEQDSQDAQARLALIYAYSKRSKYTEAADQIAILQKQRDALEPEDSAWFDALAARNAGNKKDEIEHWKKANTINPVNRWTWYELSSAYASAEEYDNAAKAAQQALVIEPDSTKWAASWIYYLHSKALFRNGEYDEAVKAASAGLNIPSTYRSTYFREAIAKIAADRTTPAAPLVAEYLRVSNAERQNGAHYTHVNISLFYFELGMMKQAIHHAEMALELDKSAYAYWALGYAMIENGKPAEALAIIDKAVANYPDDAMLWSAKAWAQYRMGQVSKALQSNSMAESKTVRDINILNRNRGVIKAALANPKAKPASRLKWLD